MSQVDSPPTKRWYVIRVRAGLEKKAIETLHSLIYSSGLEDQFGDIVTPTEEILEMRNGRKRRVPRKFFPGYILINMVMNEHTRHLVRDIRNKNVLGFLGSGDHPVPLSQSEVDGIFERLQETAGKPRPKILFQPGQMVQIISDPFVGFKGVVKEVDYEKNRLNVSVIVFQRATAIDLNFSEVKPE